VRWLWVQEKVNERKIFLKKQRGETNAADLGTKYLPKARMDFLLGLLGLMLVEGAEAGMAISFSAVGFLGTPSCTIFLLGLAVALGIWIGRRTATSSRPPAGAPGGKAAAAPTAEAAAPTAKEKTEREREAGFLLFLDADELRVLLRARGLRPDGAKHVLCDRLAQHVSRTSQAEFLKLLTVDEMKVLLRARRLRTTGLKHDLSERLAQHAAGR